MLGRGSRRRSRLSLVAQAQWFWYSLGLPGGLRIIRIYSFPGIMRAFVGFDRIVVDPDVLVAKPHVRGTRISVARALEVLAQYPDWAALRADYPGLDDVAIRQVLAFAAATVDGRVIAIDRTAA